MTNDVQQEIMGQVHQPSLCDYIDWDVSKLQA